MPFGGIKYTHDIGSPVPLSSSRTFSSPEGNPLPSISRSPGPPSRLLWVDRHDINGMIEQCLFCILLLSRHSLFFVFKKINVTRIAISRAFGNFSGMEVPLPLGILRPGSPGPGKAWKTARLLAAPGAAPLLRATQRPSEFWPGALPKEPLLHWSPPLSSQKRPSATPAGPGGDPSGSVRARRTPAGVLSQQASASSL